MLHLLYSLGDVLFVMVFLSPLIILFCMLAQGPKQEGLSDRFHFHKHRSAKGFVASMSSSRRKH